ncbi:Uncharacterised protein [Chlamydia trachomatis]|nr:Uncharacterised protein [Chlamydia trachomatis]
MLLKTLEISLEHQYYQGQYLRLVKNDLWILRYELTPNKSDASHPSHLYQPNHDEDDKWLDIYRNISFLPPTFQKSYI